MARIESGDYNTAQLNNIEKINGDYFLKVLPSDSNGDFVSSGRLVTEPFDYIGVTYPTTSSEVYTYKAGGSGGTTVATVTVTYTDSTKEVLTSVART